MKENEEEFYIKLNSAPYMFDNGIETTIAHISSQSIDLSLFVDDLYKILATPMIDKLWVSKTFDLDKMFRVKYSDHQTPVDYFYAKDTRRIHRV